LPTASSNQPGWQDLKTGPSPCGLRHPYSVLLPAGLAMPLPLPEARCALTAPFHPYPRSKAWTGARALSEAVCFLWRCPWGHPRRTLSGAVSPWSPDFPPRVSTAAVQPTGDPSDMGIVPERQQRVATATSTRSFYLFLRPCLRVGGEAKKASLNSCMLDALGMGAHIAFTPVRPAIC
jgi:hypothetical protein